MTDKKYNGWTNWETWSFNLHWDDAFREDATYAHRHSKGTEDAISQLADMIKDHAEEVIEAEISKNIWLQDIVNGYVREINFHEIATHYIEELESEAA